jgi:integrase
MARISLGGYGPSRRVKTLYGATRDAVAKQLTKALRERDTGKTLQGNTPTLQAFVETWRAGTAAALKPSTQGFYRDNLDNHILPLLGHHRVEALRRKDVVRLIRLCRELRQGDELVSEPDPFSTEDAQTFAETARLHFPRWYPFILCGLRTGLRLGELLALEWRDLDWRARTILVERNVVRGALTTPKSHQRRLVDMSPQLAAVLRLARRQRRIEFLRYGMPLPDAIFPSTEGTRLDESNVRKTFAKICTQAELRHRSPHDLRHTYASLLLSAGAPILYVSQQLGHQDAVITLRTYAQWMPKADPHAHSALLDTGRPLPR